MIQICEFDRMNFKNYRRIIIRTEDIIKKSEFNLTQMNFKNYRFIKLLFQPEDSQNRIIKRSIS